MRIELKIIRNFNKRKPFIGSKIDWQSAFECIIIRSKAAIE